MLSLLAGETVCRINDLIVNIWKLRFNVECDMYKTGALSSNTEIDSTNVLLKNGHILNGKLSEEAKLMRGVLAQLDKDKVRHTHSL